VKGSVPIIAASILTADFGNLYRVVRALEKAGVDRLHLDVMDGHFVPNLTFGPDVVAAIRRLTRLPLDLHLMIDAPSRFTPAFLRAGADSLTFHVEAPESDGAKRAVLERIRGEGRVAGLAISPGTPVAALEPYAELLDIAMIMTVVPGAGGQRFLPTEAAKIGEVRPVLAAARDGGEVHVDGGVNRETAATVGAFGADVLVVGSALFQRGRDTAAEVDTVRRSAWAAAAGRAAPTVNGVDRAELRGPGQPDVGPVIDDAAAQRPLP
jgi:ribulose-phosphate 3-epimerase